MNSQALIKKKAVFIVGSGRCGTSAILGTLNIMGLPFGTNLRASDKLNPKGYFEDNFLNQISFSLSGGYKYGEKAADWLNREVISKDYRVKDKIKNYLKSDFSAYSIFGVKQAPFILPFYLKAAEELDYTPKIIVMLRNSKEIVQSRINYDYERRKEQLNKKHNSKRNKKKSAIT